MALTKCDICQKHTPTKGLDTLLFGEWMSRRDITCHYFCLLLSTHLAQRGVHDSSGILGFYLKDIRTEMANAKKRPCMYCNQNSASIMCMTCKGYFHLTCGHTNICLFQFVGDFKSYCHKCIPPDPMRPIMKKKPDGKEIACSVCMLQMGVYNPLRWIYGKCCGNGYAHSICVKKYALNAGYYLTCIWCKKEQFRNDIKYQGVFVPDRDANWEREKGAYEDLHRSNRRCDIEICRCPKGRDYINSHKWKVITCKLCGAFGAHNPSCIPGYEHSTIPLDSFTCDTCSATEHSLYLNKTTMTDENNDKTTHDLINTTLYINKEQTEFSENLSGDNICFSDDSEDSIETVKNSKIHNNISKAMNENFAIPVLTQSATLMEIENVAAGIQDNVNQVDSNSEEENLAVVRSDKYNNISTSIPENVTPECIIPILTQSETLMEIENSPEIQGKGFESNVALDVDKNKNYQIYADDDIADTNSDKETRALDRLFFVFGAHNSENTSCLNETTMEDSNNGENICQKRQTYSTENHPEENIYFLDETKDSIETVKNFKILNNISTSINENVTIPMEYLLMEIENTTAIQVNNNYKNVDPNVTLIVDDDSINQTSADDDIVHSNSDEKNLVVDRLVKQMMDLFE